VSADFTQAVASPRGERKSNRSIIELLVLYRSAMIDIVSAMRHMVLIGCVKTKAAHRCQCEVLYQSDLFKKSLRFARSLNPDSIFVLSAKYGLVPLDRTIDPYEETLNRKPVKQVREWAAQVISELEALSDLRRDRFTFLAAERYRRFLTPHLTHYEVPMQGLGIGKQLQFLKEHFK